MLECLQNHHTHLGSECQHRLFSIRKSELSDSATDYTLMTQCREMIRQYCRGDRDADHREALDCLRIHKDEPLFDRQCHLVVVNRMIAQNLDYRYNPKLQAACSANIAEFCTPIVAKERRNEELNGKVVECLRGRFRQGRLSAQCQAQMTEVLHEQALNYRLNPLLQAVCRDEIRMLCSGGPTPKPASGDPAANVGGGGAGDAAAAAGANVEEHGEVEECLKLAFVEHRLISKQCKYEVATMIEESRADIHVDPLLQQACQVDLLKYCAKVQSGNGRQLKCLQVVLADVSQALEPDCKLTLERRMEMFQNSAVLVRQPPENFQQLYDEVLASPSRHYFAVLGLGCVLLFFAVGMMFGRVSRRHEVLKNK